MSKKKIWIIFSGLHIELGSEDTEVSKTNTSHLSLYMWLNYIYLFVCLFSPGAGGDWDGASEEADCVDIRISTPRCPEDMRTEWSQFQSRLPYSSMACGSFLDPDWGARYRDEYICQKFIIGYAEDLYLSLCEFYLKKIPFQMEMEKKQ